MKITVVVHEQQPRTGSPRYMMELLRTVWREAGHEVEVVRGVSAPIRGDIVFLHVDCTVVPRKYLEAVAQHPHVINRRAVDISKTLYTPYIVRSPEEWDGPVVVKTVRNSGGHPERRLARTTLLGRLQDRFWRLSEGSLARARWLNPREYPIFESAKDVPAGVFRNRALFVQRYLPERLGDRNVVRAYKFLGDQHISHLWTARHPLGLSGGDYTLDDCPLPDPIVVARERLGFDYGAFQYVMHNGEPLLLDAYRTPGDTGFPELGRQHAEHLAPGIESFLR